MNVVTRSERLHRTRIRRHRAVTVGAIVVALLGATWGISVAATGSTCTDVPSCLSEIQSAASRAQSFATTTTTGGATSTTAASTSSTGATSTTQASTTTTSTISTGGSCTNTIGPPASIGSAATGGTLCLSSGVYNQTVIISHSVTVQAAPGASPIIDGTGIALSKTSDLIHIGADRVTFGQGIEVRNVTGRAIVMTGAGDTVTGARVHDVQYNGILAAGTNDTISNNEVYRTVLSNTNDALGGSGWAEAVNTWQSTNTVIRDNYIHDNWGEGICPIQSGPVSITNNRVIDNFSVEVYVASASHDVLVDHNTLASTTTAYNRGSKYPTGVLMGNEGAGNPYNITIMNNTLTHTSGIVIWNATVNGLVEANNTITP